MLIALIGQDGAGKSTQVDLLKNSLMSLGKHVCVLDKWDVLHTEEYPECRFLQGSQRDLAVCISEMSGASRMMFLAWTMHITLKKMDSGAPGTIYISDGFWMKHAASEQAFGIDAEWIFNFMAIFPKPDISIYFDVAPEITLHRKRDFTPYECGRSSHISSDSFLKHQTVVRSILLDWKQKYSWQTVDASLTEAEVTQSILRIMEQHERAV